MPTIKEKLYFTYDGKSSESFGLVNVVLDSGMYEEIFNATREIRETKIMGNEEPLLHGVDESPIEFELTLAFQNKFNDKIIEDVLLWLFQDVYKPLYFNENPNKIFYCMPIGDSRLVHNGLQEGYVTLTMRCNSPKIFSPVKTTQIYDLSNNTIKYSISINNEGHVDIYPEISLYKVGNGHVTLTVNGEIFEIRDLINGEDIYIDCKREIIDTDAVGVERYDNVVGDFLNVKFKRGINTIIVEGKCKIQFRYKFKYKF